MSETPEFSLFQSGNEIFGRLYFKTKPELPSGCKLISSSFGGRVITFKASAQTLIDLATSHEYRKSNLLQTRIQTRSLLEHLQNSPGCPGNDIPGDDPAQISNDSSDDPLDHSNDQGIRKELMSKTKKHLITISPDVPGKAKMTKAQLVDLILNEF